MKNEKKKNNISGFFDAYVIDLRIKKLKNSKNFLSSASNKLKLPVNLCRHELKKARTRLYNRIKYLKKSEKIKYLSKITPFDKEKLINLVLDKSLVLTKLGIESFINVVFATLESQNKEETKEIYQKVTADIEDWFDVKEYLKFLSNEINKEHKDKIGGMLLLNGSAFFSNYGLYSALRNYCFATGHMIKKINEKETKNNMIFIIEKLKELNALFFNVNKGFYSNTILIQRELDGGNVNNAKSYGIFLKTNILGINIWNSNLPPLPEKFRDITNITIYRKG